jgi:hypothetical protein
MKNADLHSYYVFGLSVASELPLPELAPTPPVPIPDVIIRVEPKRMAPPSAMTIVAGRALLNVDGVASYEMFGGDSIVVTPGTSASERNVRLYLLGSAFAAILHQRGMLPLHSNAIVIDDKAVAFLGHPGAGKSTLAAWFHDQGHSVLSDDVCVVQTGEQGRAFAYAGVPRLRLWRDALEASGRTVDVQEQAFDDWEKYNVRTANEAIDERPLSHLYVLSSNKTPESGELATRLSGSRAVQTLVENTYRGAYVKLMGCTNRHLNQCVSLAQNLAIFEVQRPWGLDLMGEVGTALEMHARSFMESQASMDAHQPFIGQ